MDTLRPRAVRWVRVGPVGGLLVLLLALAPADPPALSAAGGARYRPAPVRADVPRMPMPAILSPVPLGSIGDLIWEDDTWNGQRELWEYGAVEVPVDLLRRDAHGLWQPYRTTLTDWEGWYTFADLPPGTYQVRVDLARSQWYQGWFPTTPNPYGPFALAPGQRYRDAAIGISRSGS